VSAVLELNDYELTLYRGDESLYQAPAMAIVRDSDMLFGEAALHQFRLFPRQANQQYLTRLNADPLSDPVRRAANHADLVYLHLKELTQVLSDDLVLAVPGNLTADQLGVLLGICQEAGLEVVGFVDAAVAAAASVPCPARLSLLDIHLQHCLLTELKVGAEIERGRVEELKDCGVTNLVNGWINLIGDRFVSETRFDPLHTAETEQQLFNQLHQWLNGARHDSELAVTIAHGGTERRLVLTRAELEAKAAQRYRRVLDSLPADGTVALTARTARIPGLAAALRSAGHSVELLHGHAVARALAEHLALVTAGEGPRLISRLPARRAEAAAGSPDRKAGPQAAEAAAEAAAAVPTHFLCGHVALPLGAGPATRQDEGGLWLLAGSELNGEHLMRDTRLRVGDVVTADGRSLTAIEVRS
jgi:hypothetical protein